LKRGAFSPKKGCVVCRMPKNSANVANWGIFSNPYKIIQTSDVSEVPALIDEIDKLVSLGDYAAGFMTYEAAPAFDEAHTVHSNNAGTLLWFAIYDHPPEIYTFDEFNSFKNSATSFDLAKLDTHREFSKSEYLGLVDEVLEYIKEGDIYQANFTFRSKLTLDGNPLFSFGENSKDDLTPYKLFQLLSSTHPVPYSAYVNCGDSEIVSISPELFLERDGNVLRSKPMKGTAHRKLSAKEDWKVAIDLSNDEKNRAENIMIVDMVRNDLGKICKIGSVKTSPICQVETYKTVHQMISSVEGEVVDGASMLDILKATFPAASITGAPKIRAMQIINELEKSPRKVYTGMVGCVTPDDKFSFNVAIRTLICDSFGVELGVGSGIVADSSPVDEWNESLLKSTFVKSKIDDFELLETMLWRRDVLSANIEDSFPDVEKILHCILYFDEHLERLRSSHVYFDWEWNREKIIFKLFSLSKKLQSLQFARLRLRTSQNGNVEIDVIPLDSVGWGINIAKLKMSDAKTDSNDLFLYHKTTNRDFYNREYSKAVKEGFNEVLFCNEKGEVTECGISSIFFCIDNQWYTPPLNCGLLDGIWRKKMIVELNAIEQTLLLDDLKSVKKILIGNSVRGSCEAEALMVNGKNGET